MSADQKKQVEHGSRADALKFIAPGLLLALVGFVLAYQFVEPAPPDRLVLATGTPAGAYYRFGERYRDLLKDYGVEVDLVATAGTEENLQRLAAGEVDAAFGQSGLSGTQVFDELRSLGSLFYEPVWVFYRGPPLEDGIFAALAGESVAVGEPGSGARALALRLLRESGQADAVRTVDLGDDEAAQAMLDGRIRAAIFVASPTAPLLTRLVDAQDLTLMNLSRAEAYSRRLGYLSSLILPRGALDLARDLPPKDIHLIAATANLVVRQDLHPALIELLMQASDRIHGGQSLLNAAGTFPASSELAFPLHPEARRHFEHGAPLLQRYLPFWAAIFVDRMKVMLLPLLALMLPLVKIMPPLYRWRMHARIYRWYREIGVVERRCRETGGEGSIAACIRELDRLESEVVKLNVPLSFADAVYEMRIHIGLVRDRLKARLAREPADGG